MKARGTKGPAPSCAPDSVPHPLSLAVGHYLVPLMERLRAGDSLTLSVRLSGNTRKTDVVRLPSYLRERDLVRAVQESQRRDQEHLH